MENLTFPEPAAILWAAKRGIVHAIPAEMFARSIPPHLGGGTILAARWKHRISTDIDMHLPDRNTLIDLLQDNDRNIVNQLGGAPDAVAGGRVKIAFEHGFLDISTFRPDPPYGHAVATVDGRPETVLSSHQILRGRLERVDQMLVTRRLRHPDCRRRGTRRPRGRRRLSWRRTPDGWGYSPLDQIDRDNVGTLRMMWSRGLTAGSQEDAARLRRRALHAGGERTILDSASRSSIDMINRLGQPGPRPPQPTPGS